MKLKATNPLVLFVGALAIGLAGCADDVIITEPPPPPSPPPPDAASISIVSITDADTQTEVGKSEDDPIGGSIGILINFDTGGFEAASLDVFVDADVVPCQTFSGQAAVGFSADVQTVLCIINTAEGIGPCVGSTLLGRFENGAHIISATLTLQDGSSVTVTRAEPVIFSNANSIIVVPDDIGPRVVGVDEQGWWGGPRDLSWFACPTIFSASLNDVCEITVTADNLILSGSRDAGTDSQSDTQEEPFRYVASYRDDPADDPAFVDSDSNNEDFVEEEDEDVRPTKVVACDGTDITSSFNLVGDDRPIDTSAPLCDIDPCQVWIDGVSDEYPITDDAGDLDFVVSNAVYSAGKFELNNADATLVDDDGVGLVQGVTTILNAWDFDSFDGDLLDLTLFLENVFGPGDLDEDDACPDDETTDPALGAATFALAYGQCDPVGDEGGVDSYIIEIFLVSDLLGNELGDGTADLQIGDEFLTELDDAGAGLGFTASGQLGADFTKPEIDPDELQPQPDAIWNPDLLVDYSLGSPAAIDASRACGVAVPNANCETLMFETVDPDLASGDPGSGVEEVGCDLGYPNTCLDANADTDLIRVEIEDGPATCDGGAGCDDVFVITDDAGVAADDMFQAHFCDGLNVSAPNCDGTDDGTYVVKVYSTDKAQTDNNETILEYSFVLDASPPVIGFGGITGLNASNAATVEFVLDASVVDRNGDGTAVTSAVVQVTVNDAGLGAACPGNLVTETLTGVDPAGGNDDGSGATVIADVTSLVNANDGDFSQLFTASNLGTANPGLGDYTYCFEITADDGAETKDGTDDGQDISASASKNFTWQ